MTDNHVEALTQQLAAQKKEMMLLEASTSKQIELGIRKYRSERTEEDRLKESLKLLSRKNKETMEKADLD